MATNQVRDSKNNNTQYASSFDSEKADAKTISEMSKKADVDDALLFANKITNKGHDGIGMTGTNLDGVNGALGKHSNESSLLQGYGNSQGLFSASGHDGIGMTGTNLDGVNGTLGKHSNESSLFNGSGNSHGLFSVSRHDGIGMTGAKSDISKGMLSGNVGMSMANTNAVNYKSIPEKTTMSHNNDNDVKNGENQQSGTIAYGGNVILDTIAAQRTYVDPIEAASTIRDIGVQVANEILATREALNARQEVRITLKDSILKDTEVFIVKDGKSLNINFVTGASESAEILNQRSGDLRTQLMEKLDDVDFVDIQVEDNSQSNADNQNQDGRSQNRFGNDDQSQDDEQ